MKHHLRLALEREGGGGEKGGWKGEKEPRQKSWLVGVTHLVGLPLPGSPRCSSHPDPSVDGENAHTGPHPSGEGRGAGGWNPVVGRKLGWRGRRWWLWCKSAWRQVTRVGGGGGKMSEE